MNIYIHNMRYNQLAWLYLSGAKSVYADLVTS